MLGKAVTAMRRLRSRRSAGVLILRYHRVTYLESDPHAIAVHPGSFRDHLDVLKSEYNPVELSLVVQGLENGGLPERGVAITFDDGYADNLYEAKPALEEHAIPATVFVTTGYVGGDREFWWDELERIFLLPGTLPDTLSLNIGGRTLEWSLGAAAQYGEDDYAHHRSWNWRHRSKPTRRHRLFRHLFRLIQPLSEQARNALLQDLRDWAGTTAMVRSTHRVLSSEELVRLAEGSMIEIGAHTVTHPLLPKLPLAAQVREIENSKAFLEETLGDDIGCFAYPYGDVGNAADIVRGAGFSAACTTAADVVHRGEDPYRLPRLYVGNWDGEEFHRQIRSLV